ncbi:MAG: TSUP family transporter [Hyphomicrobiales bacterium]
MTLDENILTAAMVLSACLAGGFLRGVTGFGGVAVVLASLSFFYGPHTAIALTLIVDLIGNLGIVPSAWAESSKPKLKSMLLGTAVGLPLGGIVLVMADQKYVSLGIYGTIFILSCLLLAGVRITRQLTGREMFYASIPIGTIMGATSIAIPMALLLFSGSDKARTSRANFVIWVVFAILLVLAIVWFGGQVDTGELWRAVYLAPAYLLGAVAGTRSMGRMNEELLRKAVLLTLLALGVAGAFAVVRSF